MKKLTLIFLFVLYSSLAFSQHNFILFKKKEKTIASFYTDSYIAFQLKNQEWKTGYITKIQNDSFWIKPMIVYYGLMGSDTVYLPILPFSFADVYAMPKKGIKIDYLKGRFQINRGAGHVHWYWIKSGVLFRIGGAGYAALNITNGIVKNDFSFSDNKNKLIGAAAAFFFGTLLKKIYKPVLKMHKKYYFKTVELSAAGYK
jgi:hypothetical protein